MPSKFTNTSGVALTEGRRFRSGAVRLGVFCGLILLAACGGDELLLPRDGEPAHIIAFQGDSLTATVGQPLSQALVAEVTDPAGRPVPGVLVTFIPPAGALVQPADPVRTDPQGHAAVQYTLSTSAGDQMVEARAEIVPETNSITTFHVSAQPEAAESLAIIGGNGQSAQMATVLPDSVAVMAVDRYGNGVPGIEVTWQTKGAGELSPTSMVTGTDGRAAAAWTLGDHPGSYTATATADALGGSKVEFTATGVAPPSPQLVILTQPSPRAIAGQPLERQPELQLQDPSGAPLARAGVSVTVQVADGEGSLGGTARAKSDESGRVTFRDLQFRGGVGSRTLLFAAEGFTPVSSEAIQVEPGPPAAGQTSVSTPNGTAGARTTIGLHLADQFGNPISGVAGRLTVAVTGANPAASLSVEDAGGGDYSASYVPVRTGTDAIRIELDGAPLPGSPYQSRIEPGAPSAAHSTADVSRTAGLFTRITVVVTVRDAQDNPVGRGGDRVEIQINGKDVSQAVHDNGDGTYTLGLFALANEFSIAISLNGQAIQGSPFSPAVR
jgi:invasin-like protein/Big-like domain-containing protein/filamin/ABP280 repeat protein